MFQESAYNFTTVTQEIIQIKLNWNFEHLESVSPWIHLKLNPSLAGLNRAKPLYKYSSQASSQLGRINLEFNLEFCTPKVELLLDKWRK